MFPTTREDDLLSEPIPAYAPKFSRNGLKRLCDPDEQEKKM